MSVTIVLAVSVNGVIGKDNKIPWYLPNDFKHFKDLTTNGVILMGRRTWDSLPKKPLPNRKNIVVSKDPNFKADGATVYNDLDKAIFDNRDEKLFIIGGEEVYKRGLLFADRVEVTLVNKECEGDSFFKDMFKQNWNIGWKLINKRIFIKDEKHECSYEFLTFERRK